MSSKRSKRKKRKEAFSNYDPALAISEATPKKVVKEEVTHEYVKLPGQTQLRIGGALFLIGGLVSAGTIYYALNSIQGMSTDEVLALTEIYGDTPMSYMMNIVFTSILAVLQFSFGYPIFKNARNPFYAKKALIMAVIYLVLNLSVNLYAATNNANGIQLTELAYGCIIPLIVIYGAYKNIKFAKEHPYYVPPEPTQMF